MLVMRLSTMGDVAMVAPVIAALRRTRPDIRITILTQPLFRPFFNSMDDVGFLDFDPRKHKGFFGLNRLAEEIDELGVDAVADLNDVAKTRILRTLLWIRGHKVAITDQGRDEKKQLTRRTRKKLVPLVPMVERYRRTIARLGFRFTLPCEGKPVRTDRPLPAAVVARAGEKRGVWVGVAPFARHKGKIYPIPLMDRLIGMLASKYDEVFIFGGGEHEKSFAEGMERRYDRVVSLIGNMSLSEEMDVIANLDAMVTMDSSSMHMASLAGTPAVSVWGATHPYAGFYGFCQDPANAVQLDIACRPCSLCGNKECIFGHYNCLNNITPESIAEAVEAVVCPKPAADEGTAAPEREETDTSPPDIPEKSKSVTPYLRRLRKQ